MASTPKITDMSPVEREATREYFRRRRLPGQIDAARRKLLSLENEARRYGMNELLTNPVHVDRAWDREIGRAQDEAEAKGGSIGFGETLR